MSLIPCVFGDSFPTTDSLFEMGVYPRDFWQIPLKREFLGSRSKPFEQLKSHLSHVDEITQKSHLGTDGFELKLDVQNFKPEEITVKTVDNSIVIEAKHEEKKTSESSFISRQFTRRYDLPKGFKPENVVSTLSSNGVLSIKCPKSEPSVDTTEVQSTEPIHNLNNVEQNKEKETIKGKATETIETAT